MVLRRLASSACPPAISTARANASVACDEIWLCVLMAPKIQLWLFSVNNPSCLPGGNDWSHYGYMEETLGQRIRKARGAMKQHEVVALIRALPGGEKFTQQTLSKLENDKQESPGSYIPYIAYVCKVSALWLVANIGPMRTDYFSEEAADIARTYETLSPDERQYIKGWMDGKKKTHYVFHTSARH